ncbi:YbjN domain-containing protein [Bombiscardovia coagulans]|uniref:Putative bacterial sensory transduction regulator n=1 Tax=Bombiscardovia coagulans TaxID=686666 RepID=A0A261EPX3_9BIFI|nr:YbjN domain-containing protein [Bombiscardovia coagulans]OZG48736.1 putative bacterial sensory transduction regulator [Bombiscardovia coagulans]
MDHSMNESTKAVVTNSRIKKWLDGQGFHVEYHDNAWIGLWDTTMISFGIDGDNKEYLVIRASTNHSHPNDQRDILEDACNAWNREYEGPTAYIESSDDGLTFRTIMAMNCCGGIDDNQFDRLMKFGMAGSDSFLRFAEGQLSTTR